MGGSGSVRSVCSNAYGLSSGLATTHWHEHQSLLHMPELWCDRCSSRRPDSGRDVLPMSQVSPRLARQRRTAYTETKISRTTENGSLTARRLPAILVGACRTRCPSVAGTGSTRARVDRHHGALRHAKDDRATSLSEAVGDRCNVHTPAAPTDAPVAGLPVATSGTVQSVTAEENRFGPQECSSGFVRVVEIHFGDAQGASQAPQNRDC